MIQPFLSILSKILEYKSWTFIPKAISPDFLLSKYDCWACLAVNSALRSLIIDVFVAISFTKLKYLGLSTVFQAVARPVSGSHAIATSIVLGVASLSISNSLFFSSRAVIVAEISTISCETTAIESSNSAIFTSIVWLLGSSTNLPSTKAAPGILKFVNIPSIFALLSPIIVS